VSYAASGITNIISEPRNQVDMEMEDRLAGCGATIDADVVTVGLVALLDDRLGVGDCANKGNLLHNRGLEPRWNVSSGDQQRVPGRYGESVPDSDDLFIVKKHAIRRWLAEGTWHRRSIGKIEGASMVAQLWS